MLGLLVCLMAFCNTGVAVRFGESTRRGRLRSAEVRVCRASGCHIGFSLWGHLAGGCPPRLLLYTVQLQMCFLALLCKVSFTTPTGYQMLDTLLKFDLKFPNSSTSVPARSPILRAGLATTSFPCRKPSIYAPCAKLLADRHHAHHQPGGDLPAGELAPQPQSAAWGAPRSHDAHVCPPSPLHTWHARTVQQPKMGQQARQRSSRHACVVRRRVLHTSLKIERLENLCGVSNQVWNSSPKPWAYMLSMGLGSRAAWSSCSSQGLQWSPHMPHPPATNPSNKICMQWAPWCGRPCTGRTRAGTCRFADGARQGHMRTQSRSPCRCARSCQRMRSCAGPCTLQASSWRESMSEGWQVLRVRCRLG